MGGTNGSVLGHGPVLEAEDFSGARQGLKEIGRGQDERKKKGSSGRTLGNSGASLRKTRKVECGPAPGSDFDGSLPTLCCSIGLGICLYWMGSILDRSGEYASGLVESDISNFIVDALALRGVCRNCEVFSSALHTHVALRV